ncbi:MAG: hypothetical protein H0T76_26080 [Nannocystis sp.]|nr:hypothetical protein [Nannocystis sp.]MBA3549962.1 hypothetical protein [Nannocystis sp.]
MAIAAATMTMTVAPAQALARYAQRRRERTRIELPAGDRFELLGEQLRTGTRMGKPGKHGVFEAVLAAHAGAVPVVMRTPEGERFQVDVMRRDPRGPTGVAETAHFALFIANRGDGKTPTDEAQAHAARALADWIAAREGQESPLELLSFRERHRAHPEGVFSLWS